MSSDRQTIIEVNRSLRNIKGELENLLEKGVIDDAVFDTIHSALPAESPLSGPLRTATGLSSNNATPAPTRATAVPAPAHNPPTHNPPTKALEAMNLHQASTSPAPPAYDQTPPPSLPARKAAKPVVANARALYRYQASDGRDLSFEKDDKIDVLEYMNQDWWMGLNQRTGQEGIFPRNYVLVEQEVKAPVPAPGVAPQQQPQYGYPAGKQGPPAGQNPYNAQVPPMAVADGSGQQQGDGAPSKTGEMGKKFGKKLGNAAIFGAGATIGSNIVNSIF